MNILDLLILVFLAFSIIQGWKRGLISQILDLAGVLIAFFVASRYGVAFGSWLGGHINLEKFAAKVVVSEAEGKGLSGLLVGALEGIVPDVVVALQNILGYVLLFFLVLAAAKLLSLIFKSLSHIPVLGTLDTLGGVIFGFLKGALITLVIVWILSLLPIPRVMDFMESSLFAPVLLNIAPGIYERVFNPQQYEEIVKTINKMRAALKPE